MRDLTNIALTIEQINNMRHATEFDPVDTHRGQCEYVCCCNYYYGSKEGESSWDDLVQKGLAKRQRAGVANAYYSVTIEGLAVLGNIYKILFVEGDS